MMVSLTKQDKINIKNMLPECSRYAVFPDGFFSNDDEAISWMNDPLTVLDKHNNLNSSVSDANSLVLHGMPVTESLPKDGEAILFLVDNTNEDKSRPLDTWFGYKIGKKWMGIAEDNEGWQEMAGQVISWLPFPQLSTEINCENKVINNWCNNEDVKLVQLRDQTSGAKGTNTFNGKKLYMCKACRKSNQGMIKFVKIT